MRIFIKRILLLILFITLISACSNSDKHNSPNRVETKSDKKIDSFTIKKNDGETGSKSSTTYSKEKKTKYNYSSSQTETKTKPKQETRKKVKTKTKESVPRYRIGAICCDGTRSNATGRGACSWHGGVCEWLYNY